MIPRDMKSVQVVTFSNTVDEYGQPRQTQASTRNVDMAVYLYAQRQVQDPIFNEAEYVALTNDEDITDANQIIIDEVHYNILKVIPSHRYYQVILQKVR